MACGLPGQPCCLAATHMDVTGAKPYFGFKKRPRPFWRHSWKPVAPSHLPSATNSCLPHELWIPLLLVLFAVHHACPVSDRLALVRTLGALPGIRMQAGENSLSKRRDQP